MNIDLNALKTVMDKEGIKNASQLAKRLQINRVTAWRILTGKRKEPSPEFLDGIKKGFSDYPLDLFLKCS